MEVMSARVTSSQENSNSLFATGWGGIRVPSHKVGNDDSLFNQGLTASTLHINTLTRLLPLSRTKQHHRLLQYMFATGTPHLSEKEKNLKGKYLLQMKSRKIILSYRQNRTVI